MDGQEGWFPRLAIKELGDEEFDYSTLGGGDSSKASKVVVGTTAAPETSSAHEVDVGSALPRSAENEEPKILP